MNPIGHPGVKIGVVRLEDPPAQDHLHRLVRDTESGGGGNDEGDHLVGQEVGRLARRWVTLGRGREQDGGELKESPVPEVPGVDGVQHGLRIGQVEVPRHACAQQCRSASPVRGAEGQPQGTDAQPCATRCEVTGEFGQGGEADRRSIRPNTGTVHPGAAHDPDAPGHGRPGPRDGEGVVAEEIRPGPAAEGDGRSQSLLVHGKVDPGQAVHAEVAEGERWVGDPGVSDGSRDCLTQGVDCRIETNHLMIARSGAGPSQDVALSRDENGVGL